VILQLRPEQQQVVDAVSAAFRAGHRRVMVSACCGFGKTELATAMLAATEGNGKRGAFIADRRALVEQTVQRFDKYGLHAGVIMADHPRFAPSRPIQVCSIQTLIRRRWPALNLLFIDEAHVLPEAVRKKLEANDCYAVGLSATPLTKGLGKYFDVVVNGPPTNRMIEMGRLVPLSIHSFKEPDMSAADVSATGEWAGQKAEKEVLAVVGDVVQKYMADGNGEKFICFAWSIAHAQELTRQFVAEGIYCTTYTADDKPEDRHEAVQEFKRDDSNIRGLISVAALSRGFDETSVRLLIDARPLRKAVHEYVQMVGRVMRAHPGKTTARVFDHSGNAVRFWHQWNDLFENGVTELDDGKKKAKAKTEQRQPEPVKCGKCDQVHKPMPHCPACGNEYPRRQSVQHIPGTLKELIAGGYRKEPVRDLWPQVCGYVLERREGEAAKKQALAIFRQMTGEFPKGAWFESTKPLPPTDEVRRRIRAQQIRFAKGREKGGYAPRRMPERWCETRQGARDAV
jgi:DNA repair protein RadD